MELVTKAIKGTLDTLPSESYKIQYLEAAMRETAENFGFFEVRTPVFEHTELFQRGVGETTDVVQKEMYTFDDKGGRSITLRPEGTAGAVRAYLEHGVFNDGAPQKMSYITSCYRYEKPQAGRLREFHQFGVENFGSGAPLADAEIISLAKEIFDYLDVKNISLEINSIGCPECRKEYHKALKAYFESKKDMLCETCLERLDKNPMRILDCKNPECKKVCENAPVVIDYLCDDCKAHFESVKSQLDAMGIEYKVNPTIVRGLDYYTRTVFEFVSNEIGAQGTVCGGGRYDGLVEELGGNPTPACGFGLGLERLLLLMENQGTAFPQRKPCELYIASMDDKSLLKAAQLGYELRKEGMSVQYDVVGRSLKAQMKYANKIGAAYTVVLGESELESGEIKLKNMEDGTEREMKLDTFVSDFQTVALENALKDFDFGDVGIDDINGVFGGDK
ncbi:MAG: histidine--tRNA ligase [Ruminococcaceae bacterium]|nr:histidine--tRNA ligase [Oscillospiraceae bacterium]